MPLGAVTNTCGSAPCARQPFASPCRAQGALPQVLQDRPAIAHGPKPEDDVARAEGVRHATPHPATRHRLVLPERSGLGSGQCALQNTQSHLAADAARASKHRGRRLSRHLEHRSQRCATFQLQRQPRQRHSAARSDTDPRDHQQRSRSARQLRAHGARCWMPLMTMAHGGDF